MKDKKDNKARFNNNDAALLRVLRELNKKFADENGEFFQSNSDLRELTGIPTNVQLIRSISKLVELGVIERKPGEKRGEASVYRFHEEAYENVTRVAHTAKQEVTKGKKTKSKDALFTMRATPETQTVTKGENVTKILKISITFEVVS